MLLINEYRQKLYLQLEKRVLKVKVSTLLKLLGSLAIMELKPKRS